MHRYVSSPRFDLTASVGSYLAFDRLKPVDLSRSIDRLSSARCRQSAVIRLNADGPCDCARRVAYSVGAHCDRRRSFVGNADLTSGTLFSRTFSTGGTISNHCHIHHELKAKIHVIP